MARDDIHVAVADRDERLVHVGLGDAGGLEQAAGAFDAAFILVGAGY